MFGYSITRPIHNQEYYYSVFDACDKFNCPLEGWHTESGPGVYEAVSGLCPEFAEVDGLTWDCCHRHYNSVKPRTWPTRPDSSSK